MNYFTADEARRIVARTPLSLVSGFADNPNKDAIEAAIDYARSSRRSSISMGVCYGFLLGVATGIRMERDRRRARGQGKEKQIYHQDRKECRSEK